MHQKNFTYSQMSGLLSHNFRCSKTHSNSSIDTSLRDTDVYLGLSRDEVSRRVREAIEYTNTAGITSGARRKKLRDSAAVISEIVIHVPKNISEDRDVCIAFATSVEQFLMDRYGADRILCGCIHFDEVLNGKPDVHIHFDLLPVTKDGFIDRAEVFTRPDAMSRHADCQKWLDRDPSVPPCRIVDEALEQQWDETGTNGRKTVSVSIENYKRAKQEKEIIEDLVIKKRCLNDTLSDYNQLKAQIECEVENLKEEKESLSKKITDMQGHANIQLMDDLIKILKKALEMLLGWLERNNVPHFNRSNFLEAVIQKTANGTNQDALNRFHSSFDSPDRER